MLPPGVTWLSRALAVSLALHVILVIAAIHGLHRDIDHEPDLVDIEVAPAAPKAEALPAEVAKPPEQAEADHAPDPTAAATDPTPTEPGEGGADAGVDAPIDARPDAPIDARPDAPIDARPDAPPDAPPLVALADAGTSDANSGVVAQLADAGASDANTGSGSQGVGVGVSGSNAGSGSATATDVAFGSGHGDTLGSGTTAGSGSPAAITLGSGSGIAGMEDQPAIDGAATTAGTAANLLAYFPQGHTMSVLVRFDRLRDTEWATAAEQLFRPLPDYQGLFGSRSADLATKLDLLVISTPRPRDATATTLVMKTALPRSAIRDLLASTATPIAWTTTKAGALGTRSGKLFPNDKRVVLSPWQGWYVLAQPDDLGKLPTARGSVDAAVATAKLPPWLAGVRSVAKESGDDQKRGPVLVMTVGEPPSTTGPAKTGRYKLPDIGLGVTSLPVPQRISLAMELVPQGWLVRGNIVFGSEAEAAELVQTLQDVQTKITDSHFLSAVLRKQHVLNLVTGLSLARSGARVSYGTSISIADARAVLTAAAQMVTVYFGQP